MIAFVAGAAVAISVVAYLGVKYKTSTAVLAAVKEEVAKVETSASTEVQALITKLKSLL